MNKLVLIDAHVCGISGDMFLSTLVDSGANKNKIINKIKLIEDEFPGSRIDNIEFNAVKVNGIRATRLTLNVEEHFKEREALEMKRILDVCCDKVVLSRNGKKFVMESFMGLINAECIIHGTNQKNLHLHESGSIDTGVDLIGSAIALEDLGLLENATFFVTGIAVGGGITNFSHGTVPNPPSAVMEILKILKIPVIGGPVRSEITTPTGAAILFGLNAKSTEFYPEFIIDHIGYGTGTKVFENIPNILRISIGDTSFNDNSSKDLVVVLETNIDDISGEVMGYLIEKLSTYGDGVKDVTIVNGITKKNRPVHILKVICSQEIEMKIANMILLETGSLGVRRTLSERFKLDRYILSVPLDINGVNYTVNIKVAKDCSGNFIGIKPEYEDVKEISKKTGFSFKKTQDLVNNLIFQKKLYDMKS